MQCLQIPVDHRLRDIIRRARPLGVNYEQGRHVEVLRNFGASLRYGKEPIPAAALNFAYDLAGPDTTGGIVVALEQPRASQEFAHGTVAEVDGCATLRAVKELIVVASNYSYDVDEISIFDAIPVITDPYDRKNEAFKSGDEAFLQMIVAKRPVVLLSCFQSKSANPDISSLQSSGVGKGPPQQTISIRNCTLRKVNAFHPSYAMNYHPEYAGFRQLLILEFAQAFGAWRGDWSEHGWMSELRTECRGLARRLCTSKSINLQLLHNPPD